MTQRLRRYVCTGFLAAAGVFAQTCTNATPSLLDTAREVELQPQALGTSLVKLAQMFGVVLSFDPDLVGRRQGVALSGVYTLQESLAQMLADTGLVFTITPGGTLTIAPAPVPTTAGGVRDGGSLAPLRVSAQTAAPDSPMRAATVSAAGRPGTFVSDLPQAATVLTPDLLSLSGATIAQEALDFVVGSAARGDDMLGASQSRAVMRGLPMGIESHGLRSLGGARIDSAFVERIEVLRGPGGAIKGIADNGGRGGLVNIVTKRATGPSQSEVAAVIDSADHGSVRASIDAGGSLRDEWAWRLVTVGSGSQRTDAGYDGKHSAGILASTGWRSGDADFTLSWMSENRRDTTPRSTREVIRFDEMTAYPVSAGLAPGFAPVLDSSDGIRTALHSLDLEFGQRLGAWHIDLQARVEHLASDYSDHQYIPVTDSTVSPANRRDYSSVARQQQVRFGLTRDAVTGPLSHRLLLSLQALRRSEKVDTAYMSWIFGADNPLVPGVTPLTGGNADFTMPMQPITDTDTRTGSWTAQDQVRFGPWRLSASLQGATLRQASFGVYRESLHGMNGDVGLSYQWSPSLTLYAGMQSVLETGDFTVDRPGADHQPPPLRRNRQEQAGLKFDLDDDRLAFTVEVFRLRQTNMYDSGIPSEGLPPMTFEGRSANGLEFELAGRFTRIVDGLVGLNFQRSIRGRIDYSDAGRTLCALDDDSIPPRTLKALIRARLSPSSETKASSFLTLAVRARSATLAQIADPIAHNAPLRLPGGAQFDVGAVRRQGNWELSATLFNATNRLQYTTYADTGFVPLLPPRHLRLALAWRL
jgi:outer membrane receptor protein involved in Fe transport